MRFIYSLLHYLFVPFILAHLVSRGLRNRAYWKRWGERFGFMVAPDHGKPALWVHAVSVGEVQAALPLVRGLLDSYPQFHVVITTTTPTGSDRVAQAFGTTVSHRYVPYDIPGAVNRFLDRVNPVIAIILETELWPNIFHYCRRRSIPVLLANLRMSERSANGYGRLSGFVQKMLADVSAIAAQSALDADRLITLGASPDRIRVTGSVKFDVRVPASLHEEAQAIRRIWGVERGVWIAASTHEGEDEQVLEAFGQVLHELPDSLLVLVPRHPERFSKAVSLCKKRGYHAVLRSADPKSCASVDVFIGDTMGELPAFYAASDVAFVGGSLVEIGGHNMLEPAALGVPALVGPHLFNFAEISGRLIEMGAAVRVRDSRELGDMVVKYLSDANLRHAAGQQGESFVDQNRGAGDRVMEMVRELMAAQGLESARTDAASAPWEHV